jgi:hypothetical protein
MVLGVTLLELRSDPFSVHVSPKAGGEHEEVAEKYRRSLTKIG